MKLSSKTQYGLRILLQVAVSTHHGKLAQGKDIAAKQSINEPYLEQIMVSLKKAGLIQTVRGRRGGYLLAVDPKSVSVLDVVEIFEGPVALAESTGEQGASSPGGGDAIARTLERISQTVRREAQRVSLADIIESDRRMVPDYVI
jgi:Rrf2 family protein